MKKTTLFIGAIIVLATMNSLAQVRPTLRAQHANGVSPSSEVEKREPLPNAPAPNTAAQGSPKVLLGTIDTKVTSREKILAYPRLIPQELGCDVTGFQFSMMTENKDLWGPFPVKGAVFTEAIKDKIKETESSKVRIFMDDIKLSCGGRETNGGFIVVEYDH